MLEVIINHYPFFIYTQTLICRRSVLCARPDGRAPLPGWVVRWASLVLAFVEDEHATLPKLLEGASAFPWFNFVSLLTGMD